MNAQTLLRVGVPGALLAALGWIASGVVAFVFPEPNMGPVGSLSWQLIETFDAIAEAGMVAAMVGLHMRQAPTYGRLGLLGFLIGALGTAAVCASTVLWLITAHDGLAVDTLFYGGAVGALFGIPLLGVALLRGGTLPRWCGLLLAGWLVYFPVIFIILDYFGEARALFGLVWLAVGYALLLEQSAPVGRLRSEAQA